MPTVPKPEPPPFTVLLRQCATAYPSASAFARAIGLSSTRMSRALAGQETRFRAEIVLRLAQVCELDPIRTLELAGHVALADLLQEIYGAPALSPARVRDMVRQYLTLDRQRQKLIEHIVAAVVTFRTSNHQAAIAFPTRAPATRPSAGPRRHAARQK